LDGRATDLARPGRDLQRDQVFRDTRADGAVLDVGKPATSWATSIEGPSSVEAQDISVDSAGNSHVTGLFFGTATFGTTRLTSKGKYDIFVAKVDPYGKFLWVISMGGSSWDTGYSISVDGAGNSHVTGNFSGTATFGPATLTSNGTTDIFVARVGPTGKLVWVTSAGGEGVYPPALDIGLGISVDSTGNSYVTGQLSGKAAFGTTTLTSKGRGIFVARVDPTGKFLWARSVGNTWWSSGEGVSVDGTGSALVTGYFNGSVTFGTIAMVSGGKDDIFVAKVDPAGKFLWARSAGGTGDDSGMGYGISADRKGNSYVTGSFSGVASFGSTTLSSPPGCRTSTCIQNSLVFVAKVDPAGKFLWAISAGKTLSTGPGNPGDRWDASGTGISVDSSGNSYVTGYFFGPATHGGAAFGTAAVTSKGEYDIFVFKVGPTGKLDWVKTAGGGAIGSHLDESGEGISVDVTGNSYVTGVFSGTATFGSTTLVSVGDPDAFVWKIGAGSP